MRDLRTMLAPLAAALLAIGITACGASYQPRASTPIGVPPVHHTTPPTSTTPPPATEMSAISRDSQAKLTGKGAVRVVMACFAKTHDYGRCSTGAPASQLGSYPAADWGTEPGQVSVTGTRSSYTLDSRSFSGAHFVIEQQGGGAPRFICRDSVSECDSGTW